MKKSSVLVSMSITVLAGCFDFTIEPKESYLVGHWVSVHGSRTVPYAELHFREQGPSYLVVTGPREAAIVTLGEFMLGEDDSFHLETTCPPVAAGIDCLRVEGGRLTGSFVFGPENLEVELELGAETVAGLWLVPADSLPVLRQDADELARRFRESMHEREGDPAQ